LVVSTPLKNMKVRVDHDPNYSEKYSDVQNHQSVNNQFVFCGNRVHLNGVRWLVHKCCANLKVYLGRTVSRTPEPVLPKKAALCIFQLHQFHHPFFRVTENKVVQKSVVYYQVPRYNGHLSSVSNPSFHLKSWLVKNGISKM